jgi:hypothetical protein
MVVGNSKGRPAPAIGDKIIDSHVPYLGRSVTLFFIFPVGEEKLVAPLIAKNTYCSKAIKHKRKGKRLN